MNRFAFWVLAATIVSGCHRSAPTAPTHITFFERGEDVPSWLYTVTVSHEPGAYFNSFKFNCRAKAWRDGDHYVVTWAEPQANCNALMDFVGDHAEIDGHGTIILGATPLVGHGPPVEMPPANKKGRPT